MNAQAIVDRFFAEPTAFTKLGEGHRMRFGDPPSSVVYQVPDQALVLKVYGPHPNKREPLERAQHEYEMLMRVMDLSGTPNTAALVVVGDTPYLIREGGDLPDEWNVAQILEVQATIEALLSMGILLNDYAQVAVRADGTAFIYDLENAERYGPTDSHMAEEFRWAKASDSFSQWLRSEGYPGRPLRGWMERSIQTLSDLTAIGLLRSDERIAHYRALIAREDQLRDRLAQGRWPCAGNLWEPYNWRVAAANLAEELEAIRCRKEQVATRYSRGDMPPEVLTEAMRYLEAREASLEAQLKRARDWAACCEENVQAL